jgi:precorrin-2/cobalt-factor-2 C20-methyltransferase
MRTLRGVRKTSVYLPDDLKADLAALARRWDRSEAELLRLAVERLVRAAADDAAPGRPAHPRRTGPRLVGVGVGPSDPDLVTERAVTVLHDADRVFAASTGTDAIGRAEMIVRAVAPEVAVDRLPWTIAGDDGARDASLDDAVTAVVDALDQGAVVAFVTLGDPNVYSTFSALARRVGQLRPAVPIERVPGVMAFQELAARTGTVLAEHDERIMVAVPGDDTGTLAPLLADRDCTVVVYKGGRHLPEIATALRARGRLDGAIVGELLGLPGGRSVTVESVADRPASYLATIVVPAVRDARKDHA